MAANNYFVVKNGLAVENSVYTKTVINNVGQFVGDPTGVIQDSYDKANSANVLAQAAFDKANTAGSNLTSLLFTLYSPPIGDYGLVTENLYSTFDELVAIEYDCRTTFPPGNGILDIDWGNV